MHWGWYLLYRSGDQIDILCVLAPSDVAAVDAGAVSS